MEKDKEKQDIVNTVEAMAAGTAGPTHATVPLKIVYCHECGLQEMAENIEQMLRQMYSNIPWSATDFCKAEEKGACDAYCGGVLVYSKKTHGALNAEKIYDFFQRVHAVVAPHETLQLGLSASAASAAVPESSSAASPLSEPIKESEHEAVKK